MARQRQIVNQSPLIEIHTASGARLLPEGEARALLTYGDVPGEYAAATQAWVVLDETDRGALRVTGADASSFLHNLLSNEVRNLAIGHSIPNLLLDPKGKVRFTIELTRLDENELLMSTEAGQASALAQALDMYLFSEDVQLTETTEQHAPVSIAGPLAEEKLAELCQGALPKEGGANITVNGFQVSASPSMRAGLSAWTLDAGAENASALWSALVDAGAQAIGRIALDSLRAEACVGQAGEDIDDTLYPQEARLESSFSLDKGCYIGQEVVAKIDTYGGLNKRLCLLRIDHDDPVPRGTRLYREDSDSGEWRDLGVSTTWAYSFAQDGGVILAYIKRKHQEPGTRFRIGDGPAEATLLEDPLDEA